MLRKIILAALLALPAIAQAQNTSVHKGSLDPEKARINIQYDLTDIAGQINRYFIELYVSQDNGRTFTGPMLAVEGEIGKDVLAGNNKTIVWDFYKDLPFFDGKEVIFKVKATFNPEEATNLGGPGKALLSVVFPGWGDSQVRRGKHYWVIGAGTFALLGTGYLIRSSAQSNYNAYLTANGSSADSDQLYQKAQNGNTLFLILTRTAAAIWVADVGAALVQGFRNQKAIRQIRQTNLGLQYNPATNTPLLTFKHTF